MKVVSDIEVEAEVLAGAVERLTCVTANNAIAASQFVKMCRIGDQLHMQLTSTAFGVVAVPVTGGGADWEFYVDRRLLSGWASLHVRGKVRFRLRGADSKSVLEVTCGRQKLRINRTRDVKGYQGWSAYSDLEGVSLSKLLAAALQEAVYYTPRILATAYLSCVKVVRDVGLLATDGQTFFVVEMPGLTQSYTIPYLIAENAVPGASLVATGKVSAVRFSKTDYLCQPLPAQDTSRYPTKVLLGLLETARTIKPQIIIKASSLGAAVKRLGAFSVGDDSAKLTIQIAPGRRYLACGLGVAQGTISDKVPIEKGSVEELQAITCPLAKTLHWIAFVVDVLKAARVEIAVDKGLLIIRTSGAAAVRQVRCFMVQAPLHSS
jgi:hypothetical protein